jgi:hypothetical protein
VDGSAGLIDGEVAATHRHAVPTEDGAHRPPFDAEPGGSPRINAVLSPPTRLSGVSSDHNPSRTSRPPCRPTMISFATPTP